MKRREAAPPYPIAILWIKKQLQKWEDETQFEGKGMSDDDHIRFDAWLEAKFINPNAAISDAPR